MTERCHGHLQIRAFLVLCLCVSLSLSTQNHMARCDGDMMPSLRCISAQFFQRISSHLSLFQVAVNRFLVVIR